MLFTFPWRKWAVAAVLAVVVAWLIAAVIRHPSAPAPVLIDPITPTATAAPPAGTPGPGGVSASSVLVMVQGLKERRLVLWTLGSADPPLEIDRQSVWPLLPSPDGQYILYSTERAVMVLDRAARRAVIVGTLPENTQLLTAQWAPDSRAVAYVLQDTSHRTAYYTLPDGSLEARVMLQVPSGLPLDVGWLGDGRPVSIALGIGPVGGLEAQIQAYDPVRQEEVLMPSDVAFIQPWTPWRSPNRQQQVYPIKSWDDARNKGACGTGPLGLAGGSWMYADIAIRRLAENPDIVFQETGIYMDRPTWLRDGRILFRATADKACTSLPSGLYIGQIGHPPVLLVEAEPDYFSDQSNKLLWSTSYALSPDESLVAWSENDTEGGRGRVRLMPLAGGETRTLFETSPVQPGDPFAFQDQELILYFIWLP